MKQTISHLRNPARKYFPLPNEIFQLGLTPGELAVYAFLMRCENRKTYQCYPSYRTIGEAVGMSRNTVKKHVDSLVEKQLIFTEPTTVTLKDGTKRNGSLLYTISTVQNLHPSKNSQRISHSPSLQNKGKAFRYLPICKGVYKRSVWKILFRKYKPVPRRI